MVEGDREVAKTLEVSEQTLHRWRRHDGGLTAEDAKRLRELEKENQGGGARLRAALVLATPQDQGGLGVLSSYLCFPRFRSPWAARL